MGQITTKDMWAWMSAVFSESGELKGGERMCGWGKVNRDAEVRVWTKELVDILDYCSEKGYSTDKALHVVPLCTPATITWQF